MSFQSGTQMKWAAIGCKQSVFLSYFENEQGALFCFYIPLPVLHHLLGATLPLYAAKVGVLRIITVLQCSRWSRALTKNWKLTRWNSAFTCRHVRNTTWKPLHLLSYFNAREKTKSELRKSELRNPINCPTLALAPPNLPPTRRTSPPHSRC